MIQNLLALFLIGVALRQRVVDISLAVHESGKVRKCLIT